MPKIAISYRRKDSDSITGRVRDPLTHHFGERSVIMDIDNIPQDSLSFWRRAAVATDQSPG
jgi:hypothetical protein